LRHAKDESKPETASVYKGRGKSLNVNRFFRPPDAGFRLVYNEVALRLLFGRATNYIALAIPSRRRIGRRPGPVMLLSRDGNAKVSYTRSEKYSRCVIY
jgi:hypothetical protein